MKIKIQVSLAALVTARVAASVLVFLFAARPSSSSSRFPDYPVRAAGEYANRVATASVVVAVEPVEDQAEQKKYFHSHLSARGILPIFLVIQNISATDAYLFDKSAVGLADAAEISGKAAHRIASRLGSGGLVDLTLITEVSDVRENLMKKGVRSKTLSPGSCVFGFVYVPVATDVPRKKIHLQVPLTNVQSSETEVLNLLI